MQRNLVLVLVALVLGGLATVTLSQDQNLPTRIAFADVQQVFEKYRKRTDVESGLQAKVDALEARFKRQGAEIEALRERLQTLNPGSLEYLDLERQVDLLGFGLKRDREVERRRLEREMNQQKAMIYKEICQEAQALGESRGYAAVMLFVPLGVELEQNLDLSVMMATRSVLWRDDRLDVTQALVDTLNAALPPAPLPADQPK